jgi:hypothetical protein
MQFILLIINENYGLLYTHRNKFQFLLCIEKETILFFLLSLWFVRKELIHWKWQTNNWKKSLYVSKRCCGFVECTCLHKSMYAESKHKQSIQLSDNRRKWTITFIILIKNTLRNSIYLDFLSFCLWQIFNNAKYYWRICPGRWFRQADPAGT